MTEKWVETTSGTIHYWISRREGAPALVFLHGLAADHTMFNAQLEYFGKAYTVLAWDAPGHGASRPYSDYNMLHFATELRRILDAENIGRCVLIGQSMGGMLAQVFIDHWPERARGFVGIDTCPMNRGYYSKTDLTWLGRIGGIVKLFPFRSLHAMIARGTSCTPQGRRGMKRMVDQYGREELCALIRRGYRGVLRALPDAEPIHCPTLLLVGEKDRIGKVRSYCRAWRDRERKPLYMIRGAGHNANMDNPRSTNRLILTFLNSLKG